MPEGPRLARHSVIPLVLRRMRAPLLTLITVFSTAVFGLVVMPGKTIDGATEYVDFFHAIYFVSYTSTTIGFGEIPREFSGAQRLWVVLTLYPVVISWFYAIGTIIGLVSDSGFRRAVTWNRFRRNVARMKEPFYLVCGYGETGAQLVQEITQWDGRAVVIDSDSVCTNELRLADLRSFVPAMCGDANLTENLRAAGLCNPHCLALLAVTDNDHTNLQVAINSKLLNPPLPVIARAENAESRGNMASFGTDHIINPFDTFAGGLAVAIEAPNAHRLYEWLSAKPEIPLTSGTLPPPGKWIVCGYGRFGRALCHRLAQLDLSLVVVAEIKPGAEGPEGFVEGKGTEAHTLRAAGIEDAAALVAASDDDADNLSMIMTARELKPDIYLVARQNHVTNRAIFQAAKLDMVMAPSSIMALRMLRLLNTPLLPKFLRLVRRLEDAEVAELLKRLQAVTAGEQPVVWTVHVSEGQAPAVAALLQSNKPLTLESLLRDPRDRAKTLEAEVLMIEGARDPMLSPSPHTTVRLGDQLLLAGRRRAVEGLRRLVRSDNILHYVLHGEHRPQGTVGRWLSRRRDNAETG